MGSELHSLRKCGIKANFLISLAEARLVPNIPITSTNQSLEVVQETQIYFELTQLILKNILNIAPAPQTVGRARERAVLRARLMGYNETWALYNGSEA